MMMGDGEEDHGEEDHGAEEYDDEEYDDEEYDDDEDYDDDDDVMPTMALKICCSDCGRLASVRGMQVSLLADTDVQLFSSDEILPTVVVREATRRPIKNACSCEICDMVCRHCGTELGYKVVGPCEDCLGAENNGHYHMFSSARLGIELRGEGDLEGEEPLGCFPGEASWSVAPADDVLHALQLEGQQLELTALGRAVEAVELLRDLAKAGSGKEGGGGGAAGRTPGQEGDAASSPSLASLEAIFEALAASPPFALLSRAELVALARSVRTSQGPAWGKETAQAFGKALKRYKNEETKKEQGPGDGDDDGDDDDDEDMFSGAAGEGGAKDPLWWQ